MIFLQRVVTWACRRRFHLQGSPSGPLVPLGLFSSPLPLPSPRLSLSLALALLNLLTAQVKLPFSPDGPVPDSHRPARRYRSTGEVKINGGVRQEKPWA
jgi:hypothetical protein